ncbi:MAG TPA: hypothetical protein VH475_03855 [Tepidisphaeraceae bacterium]|jgi:hypothetical protein
MDDGRPILGYEAGRPARRMSGPSWRFVVIALGVVLFLLIAFSLVA